MKRFTDLIHVQIPHIISSLLYLQNKFLMGSYNDRASLDFYKLINYMKNKLI